MNPKEEGSINANFYNELAWSEPQEPSQVSAEEVLPQVLSEHTEAGVFPASH